MLVKLVRPDLPGIAASEVERCGAPGQIKSVLVEDAGYVVVALHVLRRRVRALLS